MFSNVPKPLPAQRSNPRTSTYNVSSYGRPHLDKSNFGRDIEDQVIVCKREEGSQNGYFFHGGCDCDPDPNTVKKTGSLDSFCPMFTSEPFTYVKKKKRKRNRSLGRLPGTIVLDTSYALNGSGTGMSQLQSPKYNEKTGTE